MVPLHNNLTTCLTDLFIIYLAHILASKSLYFSVISVSNAKVSKFNFLVDNKDKIYLCDLESSFTSFLIVTSRIDMVKVIRFYLIQHKTLSRLIWSYLIKFRIRLYLYLSLYLLEYNAYICVFINFE